MTRGVLLLLVAGVAGIGCGLSASFACESPDDCRDGAREGTCEADGYCSFVDDDCPSGHRYGGHSPAGIANECTPEDGGSSSTDAPQPVSETTPVSTGDEDTGSADGAEADAGGSTSDTDPSRLQMSHEGSSSGDESSGAADSSDGEASEGDETSAGSDGVEPQDCNVLDCEQCLECAGAPDGPCDDEVAACEAVNGCTSGVACWDACLLTGACFDPCCEGDGDAQIDQLVLCRADHCIDACTRYEFLTCG